MNKKKSSDIIEKWLQGWSLSRNLPLPTKYKSGFKVDVGYVNQKMRYVFPEANNDFVQLARSIDEPWIFLKACTSCAEIKDRIPQRWTIQPQSYMMSCFKSMNIPSVNLNSEYKLQSDEYNSTHIIRISTKGGELASIGRVVLVDDFAIYDRIKTEDNHKRKGIARFVMKELEKISLSKGISNNFLVATEEGKMLYDSLGWEVYSYYTSVVISS